MNNEYLELVKNAQEKRIKLTNDNIKLVKNLYSDIARDLTKKIEKSSEKSLTERWLKDYRKQFNKEIKELNKILEGNLSESMLKSASLASNIQQDFFNEVSDKYKISFKDAFANMFSRIPQNAANELISGSFYKDGLGLSERLWMYKGKTNTQFDYIIEKGLLEKKNVYDLAKDLEIFINPNKRQEWDFQKIYPGIGSKKIEYNSFRLAVTSISHAYQLSMQRSCKNNPFVDGIQWHTSNSHRGPCSLCLSREGKIYKSDELPLDHPLGVCYFIPIVEKSMNDIGKELNKWVNGEENSKLDNWINKSNVDILNNNDKNEKKNWHDFNINKCNFKNKNEIKKYLIDKHDLSLSDSRKYPIDKDILSDCVNWLDKFHRYFEGFAELDPVEFKNLKIKAGINSVGYYSYYINRPKAEELALNGLYFTDKEYNKKYIEQCIESNWTVANAERHKTFVHEYGHHIANSLKWCEYKENGKVNSNWCKDFIKDVMNEYSEKYGKIDYNDIPKLLGQYASTKPEETFAEAFAEYFGGKDPRNFAKVFGIKVEKKILEYIKE